MRYWIDQGAGANFDDLGEALTFVQRAYRELARLAPPEIKADMELISRWADRMDSEEVFGSNEPPELLAAMERVTAYNGGVCGIFVD
jgi:hypothetical protein